MGKVGERRLGDQRQCLSSILDRPSNPTSSQGTPLSLRILLTSESPWFEFSNHSSLKNSKTDPGLSSAFDLLGLLRLKFCIFFVGAFCTGVLG